MSSDDSAHKVAVSTAKKLVSTRDGDERIVVLPTGLRARINPVSASLIGEVTSQIKDPQPPIVYIAEKEREEPNPSDPEYIRALVEAERLRGVAAMDAMIMFGVELLDPLPEDTKWLDKLKFLAKRKMLDLTYYNLTDPMELEFLYKRFIAVDNNILTKITEVSGITQAEVDQAEKSFPSN